MNAHCAMTYYVACYISRCETRRSKYSECKIYWLKIKNDDITSLDDDSEAKDLIAIADCSELSAPRQYCFAVYALGVQLY